MYGEILVKRIFKGTYAESVHATMAVCEGLLNAGADADEFTMKEKWRESFKKKEHASKKYCVESVSSIGWFFDSLEKTREVARWLGEFTGNQPSQIQDAEMISSIIYLSRNGYSKEDINKYLENDFNYDRKNIGVVNTAISKFLNLKDENEVMEIIINISTAEEDNRKKIEISEIADRIIKNDLLYSKVVCFFYDYFYNETLCICLIANMAEAFFPNLISKVVKRTCANFSHQEKLLERFEKYRETVTEKK